MLSRLFNARLKSAENALASGRIDEAFRLATASDLANENRARRVLEQVGEKLFARAEAHYQAGRCVECMTDLDKAAQAGADPQRVRDLRSIVQAAVDAAVREKQDRRKRLQAAQQHLAEGSLRSAERVLADASGHDPAAQQLKEQAAEREQRAAERFQQVAQYVRDHHLAAAISRFRDGRQLNPKAAEVAEWECVLVDQVVGEVRKALQDGRLGLAIEQFGLLSGIGDDRSAKIEVTSIVDTITAASAAIAAADYETVRRKVLGLEHLLGGAKWVKQANQQLKQVDELTTQIHGGPLGLLAMADGRHWRRRSAGQAGDRPGAEAAGGKAVLVHDTLSSPGKLPGDSLLPERLLMLVDGSGSYLLIRSERASIGRAATDQPADIPIISDLSERHADIARVEDDYFVFANREVNIGGRNVQQKLLQNGDKIVLGRRAKLMFNCPSRKSTSAVLDLSSGKLPHDVKRIIMFERFITLGRQAGAHVVVNTASEDLLLMERDGKLWIRHKARGRGDDGVAIELGKPFEFAGVSMVIEPWKAKR